MKSLFLSIIICCVLVGCKEKKATGFTVTIDGKDTTRVDYIIDTIDGIHTYNHAPLSDSLLRQPGVTWKGVNETVRRKGAIKYPVNYKKPVLVALFPYLDSPITELRHPLMILYIKNNDFISPGNFYLTYSVDVRGNRNWNLLYHTDSNYCAEMKNGKVVISDSTKFIQAMIGSLDIIYDGWTRSDSLYNSMYEKWKLAARNNKRKTSSGARTGR